MSPTPSSRACERREVAGRTFELCGPDVMTLGDIVRMTASFLGLRRYVLPLPRSVARVQAAVMDYVPGKPFSTDNFLSATLDSTCTSDGLAALGLTPLLDAQRAAPLPQRNSGAARLGQRSGTQPDSHSAARRSLTVRLPVAATRS